MQIIGGGWLVRCNRNDLGFLQLEFLSGLAQRGCGVRKIPAQASLERGHPSRLFCGTRSVARATRLSMTRREPEHPDSARADAIASGVSSVKTDSGFSIDSPPSTPLRCVLGYPLPPSPHAARRTGARRKRGSGLERHRGNFMATRRSLDCNTGPPPSAAPSSCPRAA